MGIRTRVRRPQRATVKLAAALGVVSLIAAACTAQPSGKRVAATVSPTDSASSSAVPSSTPTAPPVTLNVTPGQSGAANMNPTEPIRLVATSGQITAVSLVNQDGKQVKGSMTDDDQVWTSAEVLGYGRTYTLTASAQNADGTPAKVTRKFTTLTPGNMTMPYFEYTGGYALKNGATYGVGIVPVVHFDEPIADRKAAVATLTVTTSNGVKGAWYWSDSQNVHYRPQKYWPAGTKVTIAAEVYGKQVGPGLYGQADASISFRIGAKHTSVADDKTHTVYVYVNDKLVRKMPTSMGRGGYVTGTGGQKISLWTMNGIYTVIAHENPAIMSSASYGLPANSPAGYGPEKIYWATKISTDGIYLHELTATIWAQGNTDVSHGCLNLNTANATWFFQNSQIGDVVKVKNSGGPTINIWQGGEWSVPWSTWSAGGYNN